MSGGGYPPVVTMTWVMVPTSNETSGAWVIMGTSDERREEHGEKRRARLGWPELEKARVRSVPCMVKMFMHVLLWWCWGVGESS